MKSENNVFSVEKAEDSSGFLLWQVTNLWQRGVKKTLEPYDITHPQFVLLTSIYWFTLHKENPTQILLSSHTKIDPMTTSTVLRTLQSKGFIERKEHETDTRAKIVTITEKGIKTIKKAIIEVESFDKTFFSKIDKEVTVFNNHLETLLKLNK